MFAVTMMQLNASDQPWEQRTELICAIERFQAYVIERDLGYARMLNLCLSCCSSDQRNEEELESFDHRLTYFRKELKQDASPSLGTPIKTLKDVAKTVKWMCPNPYEGTKEYQEITDVCTKIIERSR